MKHVARGRDEAVGGGVPDALEHLVDHVGESEYVGRPGQPVCSAELKSNILRFNLQEPDSATLELSDSFSDDGRIGR